MVVVDLAQIAVLVGVPFVASLVQLAKATMPGADARWWPACALFVGLVWNVALAELSGGDLRLAVMIGFVTGLAASGLYSWLRVRPPSL